MKPTRIRPFVLAVLLGLAGAVRAAAAGPDILDIQARVDVATDVVTLADLLNDPDQLNQKLRAMTVLDAPLVGQSRDLTLVDIAYTLQRMPELLAYKLRGPNRIVITRSEDGATIQALKDRIAQKIQSTPPWSEWEIEIEFSKLDNHVLSEVEEDHGIRVEGTDGKAFLGATEVEVLFQDRGGRIRDQRVLTPTIRKRSGAIVLTRAIERGEVLEDGDVQVTSIMSGDDHRDLILTKEDTVGMELARNLSAGQILRRQYLLEPVFAKRGDNVWVTARSGGLEARMSGLALRRGRRGETIQVRNPVSHRTIRVDLTGPNTGKLNLGIDDGRAWP